MTYEYYFYDSDSRYTPWKLLHVEDSSLGLSKTSQNYGIPTKSSRATQVYDMAGAVNVFNLKINRVDYEEAVCNWDFMFEPVITKDGARYKGIDQFLAQLQTSRPYYLWVKWTGPGSDPGLRVAGKFKVSITGIEYSYDYQTPGTAEITLKLVERR